ncbi:membrane lipoprotein lipid attachment site-containing protein [Halalkalibacillus halophilus]|uniref:membrane lipoprotein lipid attachment site-containing protein n=1 Tax=Halalkalibacillus halophilus TaxID=392827 RepID=UPI000407D2EB|nr:membrane lipoprotein lipid attachment site-containing protein [Halalkalibacillus halophilus]
MKKYLLLIVGILFLAGCAQEETSVSEAEDIKGEINEYLEIDPYIPDLDYPVGNVRIEYTTNMEDGEVIKGEPWRAIIEYNDSLEEPVDENFKEEWEESNPLIEIIHGDLYMDEMIASVIILEGEVDGEGENAEVIEIEGHEVHILGPQGEDSDYVHLTFEVDDLNYLIQYYEADDREGDAEELAREIIENS